MSGGVVHAVVGNPRPGGRTTTAAVAVADVLAEIGGGLTTTVVELGEHTSTMFDWGDEALGALVGDITAGDALVVASPTYKASFTGLLKSFLDRFGAGSLRGVVTVPVMLGGSELHALAVETQLKPVLAELGATMPTDGIYVVDSRMDDLDDVLAAWRGAHEVVLTQLLTR
ncbi:MAG: NAD(P)H-dependent oxidoreductase [Actinomycetota bacterium]|nr:NAD(P)H-dependent oxidoreductase [Actinomycetota bacterium]